MLFTVRKSFKHLASFFVISCSSVILPLKYVNSPVFSGFSGGKILFFCSWETRDPAAPYGESRQSSRLRKDI